VGFQPAPTAAPPGNRLIGLDVLRVSWPARDRARHGERNADLAAADHRIKANADRDAAQAATREGG
jgi:hypothetical protein